MNVKAEFEKETGLKTESRHNFHERTVIGTNPKYVKWLEAKVQNLTTPIVELCENCNYFPKCVNDPNFSKERRVCTEYKNQNDKH